MSTRICTRVLCRSAPLSSTSISKCVDIKSGHRQKNRYVQFDSNFALPKLSRRMVNTAASTALEFTQQTDHIDEKEKGKGIAMNLRKKDKLKSINIKKLLEKDESLKWYPPDVIAMYNDTMHGRVDHAWKAFYHVIKKGEEGVPSASIWHWYVMIGLIARDPTVPLEKVHQMVEPLIEKYEERPIFRSLRDPEEMDGPIGQQIALYFSLMHNLCLRMTKDSLLAVLSYFEKMISFNLHPSSRHINVLCVALIHLDRSSEAMQVIQDWFEPITDSSNEPDFLGWGIAKRMDEHTVAMIMYALLQEGKSRQAYEIFKLSTSDSIRLPISKITLKLLLWAASQPYEAIALSIKKRGDYDEMDLSSKHNMTQWEMNAVWDELPSCVRARDIFRARLFACYPELESIENPLYQIRTGQEANLVWKFYARLSRWGETIARVTEPLFRWQDSTSQVEDIISKEAINRQLNPDGSTCEMKPDESSFEKYVELLSFVGVYEEIPWSDFILVLAWMKYLHIRPTRPILFRACWAMNHLIPLVAESFHSDSPAGPLHDYLVEWLGEKCIPAHAQIVAYITSRQGKDF